MKGVVEKERGGVKEENGVAEKEYGNEEERNGGGREGERQI